MSTKPNDTVYRPEREMVALETLRGMAAGSVETIEVAARQVITVVAVLLGVYFHAIAVKDLTTQSLGIRLAFLTPFICWIPSLICSAVALHPRAWRVRMTGERDAEEDVASIRTYKYKWYMLAVSLLVLGTTCLLFVMALRLKLLSLPL